ncbi:MAG: 3-isopropylmalate dehydratase small subunit [bacterium]
MSAIEGKAWVFGDNVDSGFIMPGPYGSLPDAELAAHVMEGVDPEFAGKVQPGDVIVAGRNFGCGSSRETAPRGIKFAKVGVVVAQSFARNFFRNAISIGLPVLICPGAGGIQAGDSLRVDPLGGVVENLTRGDRLEAEPLPDHIMDMIRAGGLVPYLKQKAGKG